MFGPITPNIFAYIALFGWPVVVFVLFKWLPSHKALVISILAGYLILPSGFGIDLPLVPSMDKKSIPAVSCLAAILAIHASQRKRIPAAPNIPDRNLVSKIYVLLLLLCFVTPFLTVLTNPEPIIAGPTFLPGQTLYDAAGILMVFFITVLPLILGYRLLKTEESHIFLLKAFCVSGLLYSLPVLVEVRLSPQVSSWVYGYFPHGFSHHFRYGGYRPVVFLQAGLWVGIFLSKATIASVILWKFYGGTRQSIPYLYASVFLFFTLYLSKNFGALLITITLLLAIVILGVKRSLIIPAAVTVLILIYPVLRHYDVVPTEAAVEAAAQINAERARSLEYRIGMEDSMLERAMEKPVAGWGLWNRGSIHDPHTGRNLTVPDGIWIITINSFGWMGYIATFGLLTLPILAVYARRKTPELSVATAGVTLLLAATLVDAIPNAPLTPIVYLSAGSLIGYCRNRTAAREESTQEKSAPNAATPAIPLRKRVPRT